MNNTKQMTQLNNIGNDDIIQILSKFDINEFICVNCGIRHFMNKIFEIKLDEYRYEKDLEEYKKQCDIDTENRNRILKKNEDLQIEFDAMCNKMKLEVESYNSIWYHIYKRILIERYNYCAIRSTGISLESIKDSISISFKSIKECNELIKPQKSKYQYIECPTCKLKTMLPNVRYKK